MRKALQIQGGWLVMSRDRARQVPAGLPVRCQAHTQF